MPPVLVKPVRHTTHRGRVEIVQAFAPDFACGDQSGLFEDAKMLHDTDTGHGQVRAQFVEALPVAGRKHIEQMALNAKRAITHACKCDIRGIAIERF